MYHRMIIYSKSFKKTFQVCEFLQAENELRLRGSNKPLETYYKCSNPDYCLDPFCVLADNDD